MKTFLKRYRYLLLVLLLVYVFITNGLLTLMAFSFPSQCENNHRTASEVIGAFAELLSLRMFTADAFPGINFAHGIYSQLQILIMTIAAFLVCCAVWAATKRTIPAVLWGFTAYVFVAVVTNDIPFFLSLILRFH